MANSQGNLPSAWFLVREQSGIKQNASHTLFNWRQTISQTRFIMQAQVKQKISQTRFIMRAQVKRNHILIILWTLNLKLIRQVGENFAGKQKHLKSSISLHYLGYFKTERSKFPDLEILFCSSLVNGNIAFFQSSLMFNGIPAFPPYPFSVQPGVALKRIQVSLRL